jgi:hypothetical protein
MEDTLMTVKQYEAARCGHWHLRFGKLAGMGGSLGTWVTIIQEGKERMCENKGVETSLYHPPPQAGI